MWANLRANPPTVVTVTAGGYVSGLEVFGSSVLDISGGHCHGAANDTSIVNLFAGEMEFDTKDASTVNFFGGYSEVSGADDSSTWHVTGGGIDFLHALGSSSVRLRRAPLHVDRARHEHDTHLRRIGGDAPVG